MRPETLARHRRAEAPARGAGSLLARAIASDRVRSMILWGPPGSGKTTLARVIAARDPARLRPVQRRPRQRRRAPRDRRRGARPRSRSTASARSSSSTRSTASTRRSRTPSCRTSRTGRSSLVGATTENPSFAVNAALLSRCKVFRLEPLGAGRHRRAPAARAADEAQASAPSASTADDDALAAIADVARRRRAARALDARDRRRLARRRRGAHA